jgi:hypothetical protein
MMPAITVVAPKAELERDRLALPRFRDSGEWVVTGEPKLSSRWYSGVWGMELLRECEPLRERGKKVSRVCSIDFLQKAELLLNISQWFGKSEMLFLIRDE